MVIEPKYMDQNGTIVWCGTAEEEAEYLATQPTPQQRIINTLTQAVQNRLDSVARIKNYDSILSACTYATSTNPTFNAEGQACVVWRDACWAKCYEVMAEVEAGTRAIPTSEELVAEMPVAPW